MTSTFKVSDGNTTVKFEATATTEKIQLIVGSASEYLWGHGYGERGTEEEPVIYDDLTNQEKLDMVGGYVQEVIVNMANTQKSVAAQDLARATEQKSEYTL